MSWRTLAALAALLGCSVPNKEHCAVKEGDATCQERGDMRLYCSKCVGENDGCVFEPVSDPMCVAATDGTSATSSPGSTGAQSTETGSASGGPTSTSSPMETTGPTTGTTTPGTTTTGTTTETTGPDTTSTGTTTTTASSGPDTTGSTSMTSETGSSTGEDPCGNGKLDPMEACDGNQFGGKTCLDFGPQYGGGKLMCLDNCSIDSGGCCLAANQDCLLQNPDVCCSGVCNLLKCQ